MHYCKRYVRRRHAGRFTGGGDRVWHLRDLGRKLSVAAMSALKLLAMPTVAFAMAKLLNLPPVVTGVVVLFAAMPTGANAYIFAVQYQRLVNPVSGAVALCTLLAAVTLPVVVMVVAHLN